MVDQEGNEISVVINSFSSHMDKQTAYISGPMTGYENHNFERFMEVEDIVRSLGFEVVNPAQMDKELGMLDSHQSFLQRDINVLSSGDVDAVICFDDWRFSRGCNIELFTAVVTGLDTYELLGTEIVKDPDLPIPLEAFLLVQSDRRRDYGHPYDNFMRELDITNGYLESKYGVKDMLDIQDKAFSAIHMKQARELNRPKRDNRVDHIGYMYAYDLALEKMDKKPMSHASQQLDRQTIKGFDEVRKND